MVLMKYFYLQGGFNGSPYLHTNEIQLYAFINGIEVNVATSGVATSKSVYQNAYNSSKAIDGIVSNNNYFHSNGGVNEWIQIELDNVYDIIKIIIYNEYGSRENSAMQFRIGNALMAGYIDPAGKTDTSLRVWTGTFDSIPIGYNDPLKRFWEYSVPVSCYNKGTDILCLVDNIEKYVKIENLKIGDLVKTYKNGYNEIELIGKQIFRNNINKNTQCMYKIDDLIVSGGHFMLVDKKPDTETDPDFYNLDLKIKDKYCLLACDYEKAIKIMDSEIYTIYHLVLKGDDLQYGIYVNNGLLSESTTKKNFIASNFY